MILDMNTWSFELRGNITHFDFLQIYSSKVQNVLIDKLDQITRTDI